MSWAKVDDSWWCHPKTMALSLEASGLWARALSWSCQMRRDVVPVTFLTMVGAEQQHADELVDAGFWIDSEDGWVIHDWDEYQELSLSEKRAAAGRKGGKKSRPPEHEGSKQEANGSNGEARGEANGEAGTPARPGPSEKEEDRADAQFEKFWKSYPRGRAGKPGGDGPKKPALQKWRRLNDEQREACLAAVDHYRAHVASDDGPYAAHAITWLNQARWEVWQTPAKRNGSRRREVCESCHQDRGHRFDCPVGQEST